MSDERNAPGAAMGNLPRGIGPADWPTWGALPAVRLSQALLLSIGGEPDDWPDYGLQEVGQSLLERRRVALSHLRAGHLVLLEHNEAEPMESVISLAEFGAWARVLGWELPSQFPSDPPNRFRLGELSYWLAIRQCGGSSFRDAVERAVLSENWRKELRDAVHRGELRVREPTTHSLIDTFYDDAVVLLDDLRPFLEARGLARLLSSVQQSVAVDASEASDAAKQAGVDSRAQETPDARRARLRARYDEVKATGVRDYAQRVAEEESITPARLRQILADTRERKPASPFDWRRKR
jgi:hypothetical protein